MEKYLEVERSIIKTYRKHIWAPFIRALKEYNLLEENDHICVCMSGGKDSFLMAKLFQELHRHSDFNFNVEFLVMDPGYKEEVRQRILANLELLKIDAHIVKTDIFKITEIMGGKPCFLCARMRRGVLYKEAIKLGCNKIALGHHFDDAVETTLLSMFYNGKLQVMPPKVVSDNYEGMELIRPLYQIEEKDILNWVKYNNLEFIDCACKFTEKKQDSKRQEIKELVKELKKINPIIPQNIFKAPFNCNVGTMMGLYVDDEYLDFNTLYERRKENARKNGRTNK